MNWSRVLALLSMVSASLGFAIGVVQISLWCRVGPEVTLGEVLFSALNMKGMLWQACVTTGAHALSGLAISIVFAMMLTGIVCVSLHSRQTLLSLVMGFKAVPTIALVPTLVTIFGIGDAPRVAIAVLFAAFPMCLSSLERLGACPPAQITLAAAYGATRFRSVAVLLWPWLLSGALWGLQIAAPLSVVGAIAGDYLIAGGENGLGRRLMDTSDGLHDAHACAIVIAAAALSSGFYSAAVVLKTSFDKTERS